MGIKTATIHEIKKELGSLDAEALLEICMRLAKYKKENKELLTFLLFEAHDEQGYVENVKRVIEEQFTEVSSSNLYYAKKTLRKILRMTNRQIRYSGAKQTEIELLIHFCSTLKNSGIRLNKSQVILNLYGQQVKKIMAALKKLPEDLQFDYQRPVEQLTL